MRTIFAIATAFALFAAPTAAEACSCIMPDLKQQWHEGDEILGVRIVGERTVGLERHYAARVVQPFSGCLQAGDQVVFTTAFDSAACGTYLAVGETYIVASRDLGNVVAGRPARSINSCDWQSRYADVSADDLDFLFSRPVECGGAITCADGVPPVSCLVDPCSTAICPDGTCESNYCGGACVAEFWDLGGYPVCEPW
jgi:hypothetical protein